MPHSLKSFLEQDFLNIDLSEFRKAIDEWLDKDSNPPRRLEFLMYSKINLGKSLYAMMAIHNHVWKIFDLKYSKFKLRSKANDFEIITDPEKYDETNPRHRKSCLMIQKDFELVNKWSEEKKKYVLVSKLRHPKYKRLIPKEGTMRSVAVFHNSVKLYYSNGEYVTKPEYNQIEDEKDLAFIVSERYFKDAMNCFLLSDNKKYVLVNKDLSNQIHLRSMVDKEVPLNLPQNLKRIYDNKKRKVSTR